MSSSLVGKVQFLGAFVLAPYLVGFLLSPKVLNEDHFSRHLEAEPQPPTITPTVDLECESSLAEALDPTLFQDITLKLHQNGNADPCAVWTSPSFSDFEQAFASFDKCLEDFTKFDVESLLTRVFAKALSKKTCAPTDIDRPVARGFLGFCDRGEDKTPILPDHQELVRVPQTKSLPCRFHTREGLLISSVGQIASLLASAKKTGTCDAQKDEGCSADAAAPFPLYAVPAGRVFMFAPRFIGEIFELDHVEGANGETISLEVMSLEPRVFDIHNFFSRKESATIVDGALNQKAESHRIKRSTTGASGHRVNNRRTSESGFDTHGATAVLVKKRGLDLLGFDTYIDGFTDGLQILRYNLTKAYTPHMDWIDDPTGRLPHNYDSAGKGGNRYATIFMYMSDLEEGAGGETVFSKAWPVGQKKEDRIDKSTALKTLRESGDGAALEQNSWEEDMVATCRSRLAVRPRADRAILFYSQHPNGKPDKSSLHGGCPVLSGTKYAANLWVWNTIRDGFPGAPRNPNAAQQSQDPTPQMEMSKATFQNKGLNPEYDNAKLYFGEDRFWTNLGKGDPIIGVNTYEGHVWNLKVGGKTVKQWNIGKEKTYMFEF